MIQIDPSTYAAQAAAKEAQAAALLENDPARARLLARATELRAIANAGSTPGLGVMGASACNE